MKKRPGPAKAWGWFFERKMESQISDAEDSVAKLTEAPMSALLAFQKTVQAAKQPGRVSIGVRFGFNSEPAIRVRWANCWVWVYAWLGRTKPSSSEQHHQHGIMGFWQFPFHGLACTPSAVWSCFKYHEGNFALFSLKKLYNPNIVPRVTFVTVKTLKRAQQTSKSFKR